MRASRLLSIMITLQLRGRVSARMLARQFEVSKRTIYRDVAELSAAGVPVFAEHGANGGFSLTDGWQTRLTGLTPDEADGLLFAHIPEAAAGLGLAADAATARLKFFAALPSRSSEAARQIAERFHLDPTPWHRQPAQPPPFLADLATATWETRRARVRYQGTRAVWEEAVEPLGIVLKAGQWYAVANRGGRAAILKLERIRALDVLDEGFRRPADFELGACWNALVLRYEDALRPATAVLRVADGALGDVDRLGPALAGPIRAAAADERGDRTVTVRIEGIADAAAMLLGFGDAIEVLAPAELRAELLRRARAACALYAP